MVEQQPVQVADGGPNPAPPLHFTVRGEPALYIEEITLADAAAFVKQHHYSKVMPKLSKVVFGLFDSTRLVGVITFGWGVRPQETIKKLFPSLSVADYLEIGKLCLLDELPKNSESRFISAAIRCLKLVRPDLKVLFTWADAIWGKPGYIYQASNFLFGGEIGSEAYRSPKGERIHPRQLHKFLIALGEFPRGERGCYVTPLQVREDPNLGKGNWLPQGWTPKKNISGVRRPYDNDLKRLSIDHVRGLQFRYVYFLADKRRTSLLLAESPITWHRDYPKNDDCKWTIAGASGKRHAFTPDANTPIFSAAFDVEKPCPRPKNKKQNERSPKRIKKPASRGASIPLVQRDAILGESV